MTVLKMVLNPLLVPFLSFAILLLLLFVFTFGKTKRNRLQKLLKYLAICNAVLLCITFAVFVFFQTYRQLSIADHILFVIAFFFFCLFLFALLRRDSENKNICLLIFNAVSLTYFAAEIIVSLMVVKGFLPNLITLNDPQIGALNKPCVKYDEVRGYKYACGNIRLTKVVGGAVVYDRCFTPNNAGYVSKNNYLFQKNDNNVYRYIILGDSYTAAPFLDVPWPDRLQEHFSNDTTDIEYEFYAFALDGWGISNWHRVFMNEVIPFYDFDALIIAIFGDNLNRDFLVMHSDENNLYSTYLDYLPDKSFIPEEKMAEWHISGSIINEVELNKMLSQKGFSTSNNTVRPNLYVLMAFHEMIRKMEFDHKRRLGLRKMLGKHPSAIKADFDTHFFEKYGAQKWTYLYDIIRFCKENDKDVVLASVPHPEIVKRNVYNGEVSVLQQELFFLADTFGLVFFDAYPVFEQLSFSELGKHYLSNDGHWNQNGADLFAFHLYVFLRNIHSLKIAEKSLLLQRIEK